MVDNLTKDGVYTCIGVVNDRPLNFGGSFEVYKSECDDNEKAQSVNNVLQHKNFFFIATGRDNLSDPILQQTDRNPKEFKKRSYLIREKNTLRVANRDEERKLRRAEEARDKRKLSGLPKGFGQLSINSEIVSTSSDHGDMIWQNVINKIMCNSYGRMAMAYQRARDRYDKLVKAYNEIFSFKLKTLNSKNQIRIFTYIGDDKEYQNFYEVTLKDSYDQDLPLKKIFEILQVYNSTDENPYPDGEDDIIDGSVPLVVNLNIGGQVRQFMLSQGPGQERYQILVSTKMANKKNAESHYKARTYKSLLQDYYSIAAETMITCLDASARATPKDFPKTDDLNDEDWLEIVEFLAVTQIAESNHGRRDYCKSRTPGMNKLARQLLRAIADEDTTFDVTFISNEVGNTNYPPIGGDGTARARYAVRHTTRHTIVQSQQDVNIPITVGRCYELSEDSDND